MSCSTQSSGGEWERVEGGQWTHRDAVLPPGMLQEASHGAAHNLCPVQLSGEASFILPLSMAPNRCVLSLWKYMWGFFWLLQWLAFQLVYHFAPSAEMLQFLAQGSMNERLFMSTVKK